MNSILIKNAHLISMDDGIGEPENIDIYIENGIIEKIQPSIKMDAIEVIDAKNHLICPGFINGHIHTWQTGLRGIASDWTLTDYLSSIHSGLASFYGPDDMYIGNYVGALNQINTGSTTIVDWCHNNPTPEHTNAAIRGLIDSNIRAIFLHGSPKHKPKIGQQHYSEVPHPRDEIMRLKNYFPEEGMIKLGMAVLGPQQSTLEVCKADFQLAKELNLIISMHVGGNFLTPDGFNALKKENLLNKNTNIVHANNITDEMLNLLVDASCTFSITPEEELQMGFGNPLTKRLIESGGTFNFGSDIESAMAGDMLNVIRFALQSVRHEITLESYKEKNAPPSAMKILTRQAFEWATINAAKSYGIDDEVGSIKPGKKADLIIFKKNRISLVPMHDPISSIIFHSNSSDIDTVIINGAILKQHGELVVANLDSKLDALADSGHRIMSQYRKKLDEL